MLFLLSILLFIQPGITQNVGDQCTIQHTNTVGRCAMEDNCQSAKNDFLYNGIRPTFCSYERYNGLYMICCRDTATILPGVYTERPKKQNMKDIRRVSDRKCEEYRDSINALGPCPTDATNSASNYGPIIGGENANIAEFPHMAAVGWLNDEEKYAFYCGGSLISLRFVLTAAHCTYKPRQRHNEPSFVRLGEQNLNLSALVGTNRVDVPIKEIHKHPNYNSPSKYNDIALLELERDVHINDFIQPACLWDKNDFHGYKDAIATGWGVVDPRTKETSHNLQKVVLDLFDNDHCNRLLEREEKRHWEDGVISTQMCAGELEGGKDTCQGDSGSPLQVVKISLMYHIIGVTSFGRRCAAPGKPAIYTRVSEYLDWIESIVWPGE